MASEGLRHHRPFGSRQGNPDRRCSSVPDLELSISATTRQPRRGEEDGVDYHFLTPEEFERRREPDDFLEFATYSGNRYGTLRSEVERRLEDGHSVVLEIEVQGAQQVRAAMPRLDPDLHRPARPGGPARAPGRPRHRLAGGDRRPAGDGGAGAGGRRATSTTGSSTTSSTRADRRAGGHRARRARPSDHLDCRADDQTTRRQASRARRFSLRRRRRLGEARPADQQLLPQPRRGRLRRVPAADGRDQRRAATTSRWRWKSSPRASSNTSTAA